MKFNKKIKKIFKKYELKIKNIKEVSTGKFNQTYIGIIKENCSKTNLKSNKIVLRIAPPDDAGFVFYEKNMMAREPGIHKMVSEKTSIPIPKIYFYDKNRDIIDRDFLLMEYIPGKPMSELTLSDKNRKKIMRMTGRYINELHQNCKQDTFGYPDNNIMKLKNSWDSAFKLMWEKLIQDLEDCGVYGFKEAEQARKALNRYLDLFDKEMSASLLHMDIWTQNILIDNMGNITGIVDWDRGLWGDPEIEFAVLDYCGFNNPDFWEGYGSKPKKSRARDIRMKFYHLYEVQKYPVIWTYRDPDPDKVKKYKKYALNLINDLMG